MSFPVIMALIVLRAAPHQTKNHLTAVATAFQKRASPAKDFGIAEIDSSKFLFQQVSGVLFLVAASEGRADHVSNQRLAHALGP